MVYTMMRLDTGAFATARRRAYIHLSLFKPGVMEKSRAFLFPGADFDSTSTATILFLAVSFERLTWDFLTRKP